MFGENITFFKFFISSNANELIELHEIGNITSSTRGHPLNTEEDNAKLLHLDKSINPSLPIKFQHFVNRTTFYIFNI